MFCSQCGSPVSDKDRFCTQCGAVIAREAAPAVPVEPPVESATPVIAEVPVAPVAVEAPAEPVVAPPPAEPFVVSSPVQPVAYETPVATMPPAPKKSKKGLVIGIVAAIAALLIAVGTWFLVDYLTGDDEDSKKSTSQKEDPSDESKPSTEDPVDPPVGPPVDPPVDPPLTDISLVVKDAELTYEMTDADVTRFYDLLKQCKEAALGNQDSNAVMALNDELEDLNDYMNAQYSIAMVLFYCDVNNETASQLYLDCTDILTEAYDAYMEMAKELYNADFAAKEQFFAEWTDQELAELLAYTPEVMELEQRNSEIEVAYQDLQDDPDMYTKMVPLYIEMVQNNNRIAQIYGYNNYYEYAYELVYDRDYDSSEIRAMRNFASQYIPTALKNSMEKVITSLNGLSTSQYYALWEFMDDSYKNGFTDEIEDYLETLPRTAQDAMLDMFNGNIVMMDTAPNAREGAFTTSIGQDRQICFFGPGYSNALTTLHEVGHYYGGTYTFLNDIPLDLAEVHSQGNEWLFMSFLKNKMDEKLYNATVEYKLYSDLCTILISVIVDDFEEKVYTHPNIANLTSADLDAIMAEVCENYGGLSFLSDTVTEVQNYWRMVVVEQPVYYISYGVSAIASINIFTIAQEDYNQAIDVYCSLIEDSNIDDGFLGNLENAGLTGPFTENVYIKLSEMTS